MFFLSQRQFNFDDTPIDVHTKGETICSSAECEDSCSAINVFCDVGRVQRQRRLQRNRLDRKFSTRPRFKIDDTDSRFLCARDSSDENELIPANEV